MDRGKGADRMNDKKIFSKISGTNIAKCFEQNEKNNE